MSADVEADADADTDANVDANADAYVDLCIFSLVYLRVAAFDEFFCGWRVCPIEGLYFSQSDYGGWIGYSYTLWECTHTRTEYL